MTEPKHYIDNDEFVIALTEHRQAYFEAKANGEEPPLVSDYIGECFLLLARRLATRYNFNKYTWKEDMVMEAVFSCLKSTHKFDPTYLVNGKPNAFGYFNLLCWRAFTDFIKNEKYESYVKAKMFYMTPEDAFNTQDQDDGEFSFTQEFMPYFDVEEFERKDEERRAKNRKKKDKVSIEDIIDDFEKPTDISYIINAIEDICAEKEDL